MNNKQKQVIAILEALLGSSSKQGEDEITFKCPRKNHRKSKLFVNIETGKWHCWACTNFKGQSIRSLLKALNASEQKITTLNNLNLKFKGHKKFRTVIEKPVRLPKEFTSLTKKSIHPEYKNAIFALKNRGVTNNDIIKYNMGYCRQGKYRSRIIIPSYSDQGIINYFVAWSYYNGSYINSNVNKTSIIPFSLYISWNLPIILVEGMFDAIAVDRNAIPLLGNIVSDYLLTKMREKNVPMVYLALDADAHRFVYDNLKKIQDFGLNSKLIILPKKKNPADLGKEMFWKIFEKNSINVDLNTLITFKNIKLINSKKYTRSKQKDYKWK